MTAYVAIGCECLKEKRCCIIKGEEERENASRDDD